MLGLIIIVIGALVLSDLRGGLINAQSDSLLSQAQLMGEVIAEAATEGDAGAASGGGKRRLCPGALHSLRPARPPV